MKIFNKATYIVAIVLSIIIGGLLAKLYPVQATYNYNCEEVCTDWDWVKTTCKFKIGQYCIVWNYEKICSNYENQCVEPTVTPTPSPTPCDDCECKECEPEVSPTPTDSPREDVEDGNYDDTRNNPIACVAKAPEKLPWDIKVIRNGSDATVKAFIPEGDKVNIFYRENSTPNWNHAQGDVQVIDDGMRRVEVTIHDLVPSVGYTFGVQAVNACTGGEIVGVVIDPPANGAVFTFHHWELLY